MDIQSIKITQKDIDRVLAEAAPGVGDGGGASDVVGQIKGVVQLKAYTRSASINLADVAWFSPNSSSVVDHAIGSPGRLPKGEEDLIQKYRTQPGSIAVRLSGRSSGTVSGTMTGIRTSLFLSKGGKNFYFEDQIEVTMNALAHGDSGSLVLTDPDDKIGGLFFAIDSSPSGVGFANPWQAVKSALGLEFSYLSHLNL